MSHIDFNIVKEQFKQSLDRATCDQSEIKHILDFLLDIVDNVHYDCESGHNYTRKGEARQVLKQQMLGSLDELRASCDLLEKKVKEILK